jgi:hypothetical protein
MKLRTIAIILLTLCFSFAGTTSAFAKSHHHKAAVASHKTGHHVAKSKSHHKALAKHTVSHHKTA